jgi:type I restriction enzyme S subunit
MREILALCWLSSTSIEPQVSALNSVFSTKVILEKFGEMTSHIIRKKENQKLTQLRDWLLPMLMNGQVGVKL